MWNMIWPMALVVVSNSIYHVVAKETAPQANAFLSLTVTYLVAAGISAVLFLGGGQAALLPQRPQSIVVDASVIKTNPEENLAIQCIHY